MNANWNSVPSSENIKYLTEDELRRFFAVIKANKKEIIRKRDLCLFSLMLAYGLRSAEAISLKLEHINLSERQIFVKRKKRKNYGRWFNISDDNIKLIKSWLKVRARLRPSPYLFLSAQTRQDEALSADQLYFISRKYGNIAGIPRMHPHVLRHTCGVTLAKHNFNAFAIRDRLGHSSLISSLVYVELGGEDRINRDRKMDSALVV